jgi:hypothetical protein
VVRCGKKVDQTGRADNDMYQHVNNAKYVSLDLKLDGADGVPSPLEILQAKSYGQNELYDSVVNAYLIKHCCLRPHSAFP